MPFRRLVILLLPLAGVLAACGSSSSSSSSATTSATSTAAAGSTTSATTAKQPSIGPEGIPLEQGPDLAPAATTTQGATVDGVQCAPIEQLAYHIHAHLQVYVNGQPRALPAAIGLIGPIYENTPYGRFYGAQQCYYWLHTHASDGVIHIESPTARVYTLGTFFDEWRQPLTTTDVAGNKGKLTAFVNGKPWTKDPRAIPLIPHESIDLDVGTPVVPAHEISWAGTKL
ncbi:MAG TPA: hypothetical protein VMG37_14420 [Solirubrobacteraceae bacterium]|nr:hypothetical protein [Solirubrobacteraceae bacterium]